LLFFFFFYILLGLFWVAYPFFFVFSSYGYGIRRHCVFPFSFHLSRDDSYSFFSRWQAEPRYSRDYETAVTDFCLEVFPQSAARASQPRVFFFFFPFIVETIPSQPPALHTKVPLLSSRELAGGGFLKIWLVYFFFFFPGCFSDDPIPIFSPPQFGSSESSLFFSPT